MSSPPIDRERRLPRFASVTDTLPFSEVRAHLSEVADRVERQHDATRRTVSENATNLGSRSSEFE